MTYNEFKRAFAWAVKTYPGIGAFCREDMEEEIGRVEIRRYEKSGRRWVELPEAALEEAITRRHYCNVIDAIPFFRRGGGLERVAMAYTRIGYIPAEVTSISPDRCSKVVRRFTF